MLLQTLITEYKNLLKELWNAFMAVNHEHNPEQKSDQKTQENTKPENIQMKTWKVKINSTAVPVLIAALVVLVSACSSSASNPQAPPPPAVTVSAPVEEEITQYDEFTGRFRAIERVEVRARVDGYLEEIRFTDGQQVEKGDVLFVIDQRPYHIVLEQARAELERAETRLELSKKELERAKNLQASGAVSQELIDRRNQEYLEAKADVNASRAAAHSAELNLAFTEVKAPVSGMISENFVSVGNLVSGGLSSATLLTRIVSFDPIYLSFEVSEDKLLNYLKNGSFKGNMPATQKEKQTVEVKLLGEEEFTYKGSLDFIDNEVDQSTGTMLVRAIFPNNDLLLTPGMFGKARFSATGRHRELLIPDKAIASDQSQRYVLVVDDSSKVERKVVQTGRLHNDFRIIESGLSKTDQVVVDGVGKVRPGQTVSVNQSGIAQAQVAKGN